MIVILVAITVIGSIDKVLTPSSAILGLVSCPASNAITPAISPAYPKPTPREPVVSANLVVIYYMHIYIFVSKTRKNDVECSLVYGKHYTIEDFNPHTVRG
jgi:hypothetical protein